MEKLQIAFGSLTSPVTELLSFSFQILSDSIVLSLLSEKKILMIFF